MEAGNGPGAGRKRVSEARRIPAHVAQEARRIPARVAQEANAGGQRKRLGIEIQIGRSVVAAGEQDSGLTEPCRAITSVQGSNIPCFCILFYMLVFVLFRRGGVPFRIYLY